MNVQRLPRSSDAHCVVIITDDSGERHRFSVWQRNGDDGRAGIAMALDVVKDRQAKAALNGR